MQNIPNFAQIYAENSLYNEEIYVFDELVRHDGGKHGALSAQEITITLNFGWNWISYTQPDTLDFATALENFTPVQGDRILSKNTSATYVNGQWRGNLQQFTPGWGYMYYSNRTETVSFVFSIGVQPVTVITTEPTSITTTSAICGGTVTAGEESHVFVRGLCWNTSPNPIYDDNHTSDGTNTGTLSDTLEGLTQNTTYYVRAYVVSDSGLSYGNEVSFTTLDDVSNDHEYVDLGLPSGLLWATCNVGANSPEEYGDYFAWGETQLKDNYDWNAYQYCNGSYNTLTKYCNDSYYGYNGFTDNLFALLPEDDAATANWGEDWRMPSSHEWAELYNYTTHTWTTQNGVNGMLFTASNGNSLFLPAAGYRYECGFYHVGDYGAYWSSLLSLHPNLACYLYFNLYNCLDYDGDRSFGRSVRAVRSGQ